MTVVSDFTAILGYLDHEARRWNATADLEFPVFVSYHFMTAAEVPAPGDFYYSVDTGLVMSAAQQAAMRLAMAEIEAVAGIKFVETDGPAMIDMVAVTGSDWGGWADYAYSTDFYTGEGELIIDVTRGDKISGNGFGTLLHELGHALGLSHTHGGDLTLRDDLDTRANSIMSYNFGGTVTGTLGTLDVQALKHVYGDPADMTGWTHGFQNGVFTVKGAGGNDRIMGVLGDNHINGRAGNDILIGREGDDVLIGGAGRDKLFGYGGADTLRGGAGNDRLLSSVQDNWNYGDPGLHRLFGGKGDDRLLGGDGADLMMGGTGDDFLRGGHGSDTLQGGKGRDILIGGGYNDAFVFNPYTDGARDTVRDFSIWGDTLEFRGAALTRADFSTKAMGDGSNSMLMVDTGSDTFKILFMNLTSTNLTYYLDNLHDFG